MAVLVELARASGEVISRGELIDRIWGDAEVSDDALTQCIVELRRAFGDEAQSPRYIETVRRVGIRLIPQVIPVAQKKTTREPSRVIVVAVLVLFAAMTVSAVIWLSRDQPLPAARSIAVLPFTNMTADLENQYLGDALAEEVTASLARVDGLHVVARTSAFALRDTNLDVREIGSRLNVAHVLESSVRRDANRIRITTQLIDVTDGYRRWSHNYEYEVGDLFRIQQAIASDIAAALALDFGVGRHEATTSGIAYDLYLAAKQHIRAGRFDRARQLLEQAVIEDPDFGLAHANLAISLTQFHENATAVRQPGDDSVSWMEKADAAVRSAVNLDPWHVDAHIARASLAAAQRDYGAEAAALAQAISVSPPSVEARIRLSHNLTARGQYVAALEELDTIALRDPVNPVMATRRAALLALFEGYDAAVAGLHRLIDAGVDSPLIWDALTELAADYGRYVDRVQFARQLVLAAPESAWAMAVLGDAYTELGELDLADDWIGAAERHSKLEAFKARVRWHAAKGDFEAFDELVAANVAGQSVASSPKWISPAQSAALSLYVLSHSFLGRHEDAASLMQFVIDTSSTLLRRSPHMPIYARFTVALQQHRAGDVAAFETTIVELQRLLEAVGEQGVDELPWISLLSASTYALRGDEAAAEQKFRQAVEQGWRAWTLEQLNAAAPLIDYTDIVEDIEQDLDRMRQEVHRRGLAQSVDLLEGHQ